jgi:GNAT superfamily N-acetyltransferase
MAVDQGRGISQSTREPRGRRDKQGAAMSMAEASSSSNELLADDAERVAAGLRIQALDFSHCTHFQRILSGLDQSPLRHRVGPLTRDDCLNEHANRAFATEPCIFGVFVGESLQGTLELYDGEAPGYVDVTLVVDPRWCNKGLGWALLSAAMQWMRQLEGHTIRMSFSRNNWPMRALAHRANAQLSLAFDEISACINVTGLNGSVRKNGTRMIVG